MDDLGYPYFRKPPSAKIICRPYTANVRACVWYMKPPPTLADTVWRRVVVHRMANMNMVWTRLIHLDPPSTHTIHKMKFYHVLPHNFSTLTILCGYLEGLGARFRRHFRRTMLDGRILRVIFQRVKRTGEDPNTWHWKKSSSVILDATRLLLSDSSITITNTLL